MKLFEQFGMKHGRFCSANMPPHWKNENFSEFPMKRAYLWMIRCLASDTPNAFVVKMLLANQTSLLDGGFVSFEESLEF